MNLVSKTSNGTTMLLLECGIGLKTPLSKIPVLNDVLCLLKFH